VSSVVLQVRPGSVIFDFRVFMSPPPASSLLTAASLSSALGVTITNVAWTFEILEIEAPSPPPPSPPPPSMPPTEMVRAPDFEDSIAVEFDQKRAKLLKLSTDKCSVPGRQ
jgi:hypothetical protein